MSFMSRIKSLVLGTISAIWELVVLMWLTFYFTTESIVLFFTPSFMRAQVSLKDKVVLVTGGAGGVGQELAIRLARIKAKVVIWDVNDKGNYSTAYLRTITTTIFFLVNLLTVESTVFEYVEDFYCEIYMRAIRPRNGKRYMLLL